MTHKLSAYANDLLFYITQPMTSLPSLMQEFQNYNSLSNYSINLHKSEVLNISLPLQAATQVKSSFLFKWAQQLITCLGTQITPDLSGIVDVNVVPLLHTMKKGYQME